MWLVDTLFDKPRITELTRMNWLQAAWIGAAQILAAVFPGALTLHQWGTLAIGFTVSFFVVWAVVAWFMAWVRRRGFAPFAVYRILLGLSILFFNAS